MRAGGVAEKIKMEKLLPSEKQIQKAIIEALNYHNCWCWRQNAGMLKLKDGQGRTRVVRVGIKGISDIIGIQRGTGRLIAIEVKTPKRKNKVTFYQRHFLDLIREYGGISGVACSPKEALEIINENSKNKTN